MAFRTLYDDHDRFYSNKGSRMKKEYKLDIDKNGASVFKCVGEFCFYDQIQAYKDSCDLELIIAKFKLTGDPSLFNSLTDSSELKILLNFSVPIELKN